jgi:hypothetical protein
MPDPQPILEPVVVKKSDVWAGAPDEVLLEFSSWDQPVNYLVGRNGTSKSRTARAIANKVAGSRHLSTDRLVGLMNFLVFPWGAEQQPFKGLPLDDEARQQGLSRTAQSGVATRELYSLRDRPDVWLRVAAFIRRTLCRDVELREMSGFLDPVIRIRDTEYSLLRDEGHGLRELLVLLTAIYSDDWSLLVLDEPELHLHPAMARLCIGELERECRKSGRHAIVVTHEPLLVNPTSAEDLGGIWLFQLDAPPMPFRSFVTDGQVDRVTASMARNPRIIGQLVFSPRPVLVEGILDVAAMTTAVQRSQEPEAIAQTDLIDCKGNGSVALWYTIAKKAGLDFRAVGDLDCILDSDVQHFMDGLPEISQRYRKELFIEPASTSAVVRPLFQAMNAAGVPVDRTKRAEWLANEVRNDTGHSARIKKVVAVWRDLDFWIHEQGTLEDVLGIDAKQVEAVITAANTPGAIDEVTNWASYRLDPKGEVEELLGAAVERIAHRILEALRMSPDLQFTRPVGGTADSDSRLVDIAPLGDSGRHRLTVRTPVEFEGYWLEFDRTTPSEQMVLHPPVDDA